MAMLNNQRVNMVETCFYNKHYVSIKQYSLLLMYIIVAVLVVRTYRNSNGLVQSCMLRTID
jgi:hypothetical protein